MTKINYQLFDGREIEIDVPDEVAEVTVDLNAEEQRQKWREKKRNTASIDELKEKGFEISSDYNLEDTYLNQMDIRTLNECIKKLTPFQQELIHKIYFLEIPIAELAERRGVSRRSLYYSLSLIHKKIKKFLEKDFSN